MANRFWVGGTGTWDASDTTHWAAASAGAGGQSVPGSSDTVTFDGSSGGGTVTVNTTVTIQTLTCGAFTGTLDFSANNNNVTLSAPGGGGFSGTGTGARTINLGNGLWTLSSSAASWDLTTVTSLTFNANSSTISFSSTAPSATRSFITGAKTYNAVTVAAHTTGFMFAISGAATIASLTVPGGFLTFQSATTCTVTTLTCSGSTSSQVLIAGATSTSAATVAITNATLAWCAFKFMTFTGAPTALNSFDHGGNGGITIKPPVGGALVRRRAIGIN